VPIVPVATPTVTLQHAGPQQRSKRRWYVRWWAITAYVVVALIVVAAVAGNHKTTPQAPTQPAAAATSATAATTAPATPTTTAPAAKTYSDGTYLVGTDMPAGNYKGSVSGGSGYWQVSSDANGNNIVANDNPTGAFYVQVRSGQYLTLQGATVAKAASTPAAAPSSQTYSDGTYLVGTDIPAGSYKGTVSGGTGYWQVSKDANGNNILANGNPVGSFYVQIKKGQYLKISGAEITRATTATVSSTAKTVSDGTYLVGTDIRAGRYKGSVDGGSGYWQVSRDANGDNIVANDNPTGSFYVQVKNGQYLTLSGATIKRVN
jgi:hypothetical protein